MPSGLDRTGSLASDRLGGAFELAREWAGSSCRALILSGSHATGEAVWIEHRGLPCSLSDLDLYAVVADSGACRDAALRARAARPLLARRLLELGLAAPLEVGFFAPRDLERLPARPGTLELRQRGRVVFGDSALLERVPAYGPRDVSDEETLLLLENRAFELLAAHPRMSGGAELDRWRARHAVLKTALDLAGVVALAGGEYPDSSEARVAWARRQSDWSDAALERLWEKALAWRRAPALPLSEPESREEWSETARAWVRVWLRLTAMKLPGDTAPIPRAVSVAARARARRRLRQAIAFEARGGEGPSAWQRWRFAALGTPQHRLNASAAILLIAASREGDSTLSAAARGALRRLGAVPVAAETDFPAAAAAAVRLWDRWILEGQRSAEPR
ncbi:MAG TPA: hypothetical protein VL123_00205 [Candidatus Udaeobacter sp.]|nr:hypothetical protein [Candidatus Udaeobacter sp.]